LSKRRENKETERQACPPYANRSEEEGSQNYTGLVLK
jgi:hypothetical protein